MVVSDFGRDLEIHFKGLLDFFNFAINPVTWTTGGARCIGRARAKVECKIIVMGLKIVKIKNSQLGYNNLTVSNKNRKQTQLSLSLGFQCCIMFTVYPVAILLGSYYLIKVKVECITDLFATAVIQYMIICLNQV